MAKAKPKSKKGKKKHTIEFTPLSVVIWCAVSIFIFGWIFVLGILVGRGFLPTESSTISALKEQVSKLAVIAGIREPEESKETKKPEPDPKLAFYERLSSKKDAVKKEVIINDKPETVPEKKGPRKKSQTASKPPSEKQEINNIRSPNENEQSSNQKIKYTVQLASLGKIESAKTMINQLINHGHPAYYYMVKVNEKIYYRIRCGKFSTMEEATNYADRLEREEGIRGFVSRFEK
ncbi:SPOR domain-containing protein [Thermodesulfobacteriota bacterium]